MKRIRQTILASGFLGLALMLTVCHRGGIMNRHDAEKALKSLDSDMTRMSDGVAGSAAGKALNALYSLEDAPLPVKARKHFSLGPGELFSFDRMKGIYEWDRLKGKFEFTGASDKIIIKYPMKDSRVNDACCTIYSYQEVATTSFARFPLKLKADIIVGDEKVFSIDHTASLYGTFPGFMKTDIRIGKGYIHLLMKNHMDTIMHKGKVDISLLAGTPPDYFIRSSIHALTETGTGGTYSISILKAETKLFDYLFSSELNYYKVSPNSKNYIEDFNRYCKTTMVEAASGSKVGDLILMARKGENRVDYGMRFSDGSVGFLSDFLLLFNKFIQYKQPK